MSDTPEPVRPQYDRAWIGAVIPAAQQLVGIQRQGGDSDLLPAVAQGADRAVVLVLDGLGWEMLRDNAGVVPTMAAMSSLPITCAAPSTTAAGLPSITTGLTPSQHGLLGYRIGLGPGVLNVLRWRMDNGRKGPDAVSTQPVSAFGGHPHPTVVRSEFQGTGFSEAHLHGGDIRGWQTPAVLRSHLAEVLEGADRIAYAYYDGIDKVAHAHGLHGPAFTTELADADRLVRELLQQLPSEVVLLVTADHGHVEVGPQQIRPVDVDQRLVRQLSGESRFRSVYAKANKQQALLRACQDAYGDVAWVFTREELFEDGWLGPRGADGFRRRLGDVVLAPFADIGFADPATPREDEMASRHGSLTEAEMLVPLLAARGRA